MHLQKLSNFWGAYHLHPRFLYYFFCILRDKSISTGIAGGYVSCKRPSNIVGRLHKKSGMRKHTRRKMVLPAGIVRSAATEQRLFAARRNRVTLFRRPRREYKRDRVCASIPGEKWYSRRESNPQRPFRSCTYFVNRGKYHPFFCKIGIKIGF